MNGLHAVSLSACLMILTPLSVAQPMAPPQRPEPAVASVPDELRLELGLTRVQSATIVRLHEQFRQETVDLRARAATLQGDRPTGAAVFQKPGLRNNAGGHEERDERDAVAGQIGAAAARYRSAVRAQLSEPQRSTLDRLEQAAALQKVIEQAHCFALLMKTPPDEPAACGQYLREP
jgi:hypothetical protein